MIAIDLNKQQSKETILDFPQGTVKVLWICSTILFYFNTKSIKKDSIKHFKCNIFWFEFSEIEIRNEKWYWTFKISSKVFGNSNCENNFPHKLLLTNT